MPRYMRWLWCFRVWAWAALAFASLGCAHTISEPLRQQADTTVTLMQLRETPEAYKDRIVILAGEILQTQNTRDGTLLEILQKPMNAYERPLRVDQTQGRYMALCGHYLDAAIYKKGREITIAGRVLGTRKGRVGEVEYTYPLISCLELHLWAEPVPTPYLYDPYPWWYWDPWYRRPYFYPYWRLYPFGLP